MNTNRKGNISEAKILQAFVSAGYIVLLPFGNGAPYDLVVDIHGKLFKVQVKTGRLRNGCVIFPVRRFSGHIKRDEKYNRSHKYSDDEIDLFAIYCPDNEQIYINPVQLGIERTEGRLRVIDTQNNQQQKIRWANEFTFEFYLEKLRKDLVEPRGIEPLTS